MHRWPKSKSFQPNVDLSTARDSQRLVVIGTRADGVTVDLTAEAQFKPANAAIVRFDGPIAYPVADGETNLDVAAGGQTIQIPVVVKQATADRTISFKLDVMPVFMRTGCNTGSCHGAARGKDGFRLSLFGFDPDGRSLPADARDRHSPHQFGRAARKSFDRKGHWLGAAHRRQAV